MAAGSYALGDSPTQHLGILRTVIDHDQVLHVARLARLGLSEKEVETMAKELSGILEHVDRISELDLEGVEPTSHVVDLENVLRPDEPRPSWPRERMLEQAPEPDRGAFRVPSPQAEA
jgi:aspartyl-tRNA(Asn)/glutamyl-tRNA(Gln) amidotransferase subunit C